MAIGGLGPHTFDNLGDPHSKKPATKEQKTALKALADVSEGTAADSTLNESEVSVNEKGGLISLVAGAIWKGATYLAGGVKTAAVAGISKVFLYIQDYDKRIASLENDIETMTGSLHSCDFARTLAKHQLHKFQYFLQNPDTLTEESAKSGTLKNFLTVVDGKVQLSLLGGQFLDALTTSTSRELLEKTFELNILKAVKNAIPRIKELKPEFAIELLQDIMFDAKEALSKKVPVDAGDHAKFMDSLQDSVVSALFPHGESDIEIPQPFSFFLSKSAFKSLMEKQLPRKLSIYYEKATAESLKYKLLATAADALTKLLEKEPAEKKAPAPLLPTYGQQAKFNKGLKELVSALIDSIDDPTLKLLKRTILKKVDILGPQITGKLLGLNAMDILNQRLAAGCSILSHDGYWMPQDNGKERFHYVPHAPTTREERAAINKQQLQESKAQFEKTLTGLATKIDQQLLHLSKKASATRAKNVKEALKLIQKRITYGLVRFLMKACHADKRITKLSQRIIELSEKTTLDDVAKPIKKSVSRKT